MFSEYGPGDGEENCDNGVDFIKTLVLSPFYSTAGAAMNWDWQYPGQEFLWHHMGPLNQLMRTPQTLGFSRHSRLDSS